MNAPAVEQTVRQSRRSRGTATPGSMKVPSNEAAIRTPRDIDHHAVVAAIMLMKGKDGNGYGDRIVMNKGRQHVFTLACNQIKSMLGMEAKDAQGVSIRLPEGAAVGVGEIDHPRKVREAISSVLDVQWNRFKTYGGDLESSDIKWTWDKPKHTVIAKEKSLLKDSAGNALQDLELRWKATAVSVRESKDVGERILCAYAVKKNAEKRLANMDLKPGKYDRDDKREVIDLIHLTQWKIGRLEIEKQHNLQQAIAIEGLDRALASGQMNQEQYAIERKAIEAQPVPVQQAVQPAVATV